MAWCVMRLLSEAVGLSAKKASVGVRTEGLAHTTCQAFLSGISDLFKRAAYLAPSLRVHFARKVAGNLLNALVRGDTGRCGS